MDIRIVRGVEADEATTVRVGRRVRAALVPARVPRAGAGGRVRPLGARTVARTLGMVRVLPAVLRGRAVAGTRPRAGGRPDPCRNPGGAPGPGGRDPAGSDRSGTADQHARRRTAVRSAATADATAEATDADALAS